MCKKGLAARGIFVAIACVLLSLCFAVSRHFIPQGVRQVITVEHQIRRVLSRAQKETVRDGATIQKMPEMANPPSELVGTSVSLENATTHYKRFLTPNILVEPENLALELSPVLNL
jgi:hypothetical protein